MVVWTFWKLTKIPWAVSGRRYATDDSSSTGPTWVLNMRLNWRASVNESFAPQFGQAPDAGRWSARNRCLQLLQSTSGSVNVATWPLASQTLGAMRIAASIPTTSSRSWTIERHHCVLHVALEQRAERAVVPGGAEPAVDLARREHEATPLAQVDDAFHQIGLCHGDGDRIGGPSEAIGRGSARRCATRATRRCAAAVRSGARSPRRRAARPHGARRREAGRRARRRSPPPTIASTTTRESLRTRRPPRCAQSAQSTPPSSRSKAANPGGLGGRRRTGRRRRASGGSPRARAASRRTPCSTIGDGSAASVSSAFDSIRYSAGLGSRSWATWSTASSIETAWVRRAVVLPQRAVRVDGLDLGDDVELAAPVALQRDVAHRLQPGPEAAARACRIPFATARTLPCPCVRNETMRSASPSLIVRRTTPWSR